MPKYDLSCVVVLGKGKRVTGAGVDLPQETGDNLVKRGLAKLSAGQSAPAAPAGGAKPKGKAPAKGKDADADKGGDSAPAQPGQEGGDADSDPEDAKA